MQQEITIPNLCDVEAEQALLGSALINPSVYDICANVKSSDFWAERHGWAWAAGKALKISGIEPDFVSLSNFLERQNKLGDLGGIAYLTACINCVPTWINAEHYARIVLDYAQRRNIADTANQLAKAAYDTSQNVNEQATIILEQMHKSSRVARRSRHIKEHMSETYDRIVERSKNPTKVWGIASGLVDLDHMIGGFQPGTVFDITGPPGVRKSILMGQALANIVMGARVYEDDKNYRDQPPVPSACYSLEMDAISLCMRWISGYGKIPTRHLLQGNLDAGEWDSLTKGVADFSQAPLYIYEDELDLATLRADLYYLKQTAGVRLCAIDYMLLMNDRGKDENERSTNLGQGIKNIAKALNVAIITINSMTKAGMDKNAGNASQSDMKGTAEKIHASDYIGNLYPSDRGTLLLTVTKVRHVPIIGPNTIEFAISDLYPTVNSIERKPIPQFSGNGFKNHTV